MKLSNRSDIETFRALDNLRLVNEKIAAGEDIIRLEAGQPCFGAPNAALEHAISSIQNDPCQGYTDSLGMLALRDRISNYYSENYDLDVPAKRIAVTVGSSAGFILSFLSAFDAGDTVAVCTPTYAAYINILKSLDLNIVEIPTGPETNFQPSVDLLQDHTGPLHGIIINSPSNPTGTIIDPDVMNDIIEWCQARNVLVISDEAYHNIAYTKPDTAQTALAHSQDVLVLNTFSKYFAMTGWRLGWLVVPEMMCERIKKLAESLFVSPPTISQNVALEIFNHTDTLDEYVEHYKTNRDILAAGLPKIGLSKISKCDGAFYIYIDVSDYTENSQDFCKKMLDEAKVSATSGLDFDPSRGHKYIRISYAGSAEKMREALARLEEWLPSQLEKKAQDPLSKRAV